MTDTLNQATDLLLRWWLLVNSFVIDGILVLLSFRYRFSFIQTRLRGVRTDAHGRNTTLYASSLSTLSSLRVFVRTRASVHFIRSMCRANVLVLLGV